MIEVISLHIPKTAGKSFYKILQYVYGDKLDTRTKRKDYFPGKVDLKSLINNIPDHVSVIHGHLFYRHVIKIKERDNSKVITWLRDPVDRVISNYYFLMQSIRKNPNKKHQHQDKINYTLLDYAAEDSVRNRMSKYLDGIELEELFFIGILESFDEDLLRLSKMLDWQVTIPNVFENSGSSYRESPTCETKTVTIAMRDKIRELNMSDVHLYEKALDLRNHYKKGKSKD